jgi:hypothetical protein
MTFDIVFIELRDGSVKQWLDHYNDLLGALRGVARPRECNAPDASTGA